MAARLERGIGRWDFVALTINAVIGAGIFGLPSRAYALIGPYSLLAFVACGVVALLIVLCFAEVGSRFTETGGPYLYARAAFGPSLGFTIGWLVWVSRVAAFAANANLLMDYGSYFFPALASGVGRAAVISCLTVALTILNLLGIRQTTRTSNLFTLGKLTALLGFIVAGLFFVQGSRLALPPMLPGYSDFSLAVLLLVYAFTGFEMAVIPGGEIRHPQRTVPLGLVAAIVIIVTCYVLIQFVCIGTLPDLAHSSRPLADASRQVLGPADGAIITAGALVSILGNLNIVLLTASRLPYAMGERQELPAWLARTNRYRTPHYAILGTAAVMLALTVSGTFAYAATVSTLARLLGYGSTAAALLVLRRRDTPATAFLLPGGPVVAVTALLLIVWLISNSTAREARDAVLVLAAGWLCRAAAYYWSRRSERPA